MILTGVDWDTNEMLMGFNVILMVFDWIQLGIICGGLSSTIFEPN